MQPPLHWATASPDELPQHTQWLGDREREHWSTLTHAPRRADWLIGRWAAKRALAACMDEVWVGPQLEIRAAEDGAPEGWWDGRPLGATVSLSHRDGHAVAVADPLGWPVGVDLERVEPRSPRFVRDFFTPAEAAVWAQLDPSARDVFAVLVWSAKESALKCRREGLRRDTRSVELVGCTTLTEEWSWLELLDHVTAARLDGWARRGGAQVMTVVTERARGRPVTVI